MKSQYVMKKYNLDGLNQEQMNVIEDYNRKYWLYSRACS